MKMEFWVKTQVNLGVKPQTGTPPRTPKWLNPVGLKFGSPGKSIPSGEKNIGVS